MLFRRRLAVNPVIAPRLVGRNDIPPIIPSIPADPITRQDVTEAVDYKLQIAKRRKIDPEAVPLDLLVEATIAENKVVLSSASLSNNCSSYYYCSYDRLSRNMLVVTWHPPGSQQLWPLSKDH